MQGVTEADKGNAGDRGGKGRMDKTGCDSGAGLNEGDQDPCHAGEV